MTLSKKHLKLSVLSLFLLSSGSALASTELTPPEEEISTAPTNTCDECLAGQRAFMPAFGDTLRQVDDATRIPYLIKDKDGNTLATFNIDNKTIECTLKDSIARLFYDVNNEKKELFLDIVENKVASVRYIPTDGDPDDESTWTTLEDSIFLGLEPKPVYLPLGRFVGQTDASFHQGKNAGEYVIEVTSLIERLKALGDQASDNHKTLTEAITQSVKDVTSNVETLIKTQVKANDPSAIIVKTGNQIISSVQHLFAAHQEGIGEGVVDNVKQTLGAVEKLNDDVNNLLQTTLGIKILENGQPENGSLLMQLNSLVRGILAQIGLTSDVIQTIQTTSQLLQQQGQLPSFYIGSLEHLMFGHSRLFSANDDALSLRKMISEVPALHKLNGIDDYSDYILNIASKLEKILGFVSETDAPTFNLLLPYLIQLFGNQVPIYDVAESNVTSYSESAQFSEEDYGLYAWVHSLYTTLSNLKAALDENMQGATAILQAKASLDLLIAGKVRNSEDMEISPFPENHLGGGLETYEQILDDCLARFDRLGERLPSVYVSKQLKAFEDLIRENQKKNDEILRHIADLCHRMATQVWGVCPTCKH